MSNNTIMLLDMNSFFASVEQQANHKLRGRPVGVVASMHKNSCLIAASKEAKKLGIKTGSLLWRARQICPDIALVESDPDKYRQVNKRFNRILDDFSAVIEKYSIDESFLDFSQSRWSAVDAVAAIKKRMAHELGKILTCSIGVGENKFLAKLASDLSGPDGFTVLHRAQLPEVYKGLRMSDLWGVGRGWEKRLARLGLVSPAQVLDYPVANLMAVFGKPGFYIWERINGLEQDTLQLEEERPKSFGHSWVLNFRTMDKSRLAPVVVRLAEKAGRRMRAERLQAYGVYVTAFTLNHTRYHKSFKLSEPVLTGADLFQAIRRIWDNWEFDSNVTYLACGFFCMKERHQQMSLFDHKNMSDNGLVDALDAINDKYGEFTIRPGAIVHNESYTPDAIAFGL